MTPNKSVNRYRHLLVICVLLIVALSVALFEAKTTPTEPRQTPTAAPSAAQPDSQPLFRIGERVYGYADLSEEFQTPLYQIRKVSFEQQMLVLEQAIIETHVLQQASGSEDPSTALKQLFPQIAVTEAEVVDYYQQNQNNQTPPFEVLRNQLGEYLLSLKYENAKRELLTEMLVSGNAQVLFEAPTEPVSEP